MADGTSTGLLELSRNGSSAEPAGEDAGLHAEEGTGGESVITQVTQGGDAGAQYARRLNRPRQKMSWARSLLCCLGPSQNAEYTRGPDEHIVAPMRPGKVMAPPYHGPPCMPPLLDIDKGKKCLVLDLDETLVHSSFKPIPNPDYIIPVEIDNKITDVYVLKRPFVDDFMAAVGERFEVVIFTASLSKYADPLLDLLDVHHVMRHRLFRESCCPYEGNYVKDLTRLGRDMAGMIIVDNSPHSYIFQPENAIAIGTFIDDMEDRELLDLIPYLAALQDVPDVTAVLGEQNQDMMYPMGGGEYYEG
mmetsp:Transcript_7786/g.26070  ORF Transcript_7786/g.26070 Transcript_7786/m.26070 type:complete len:304 (+) Transcript_7786:238-1149(+)